MAPAGFVFRIDGCAKQDAVAVGSRCPDDSGIDDPATDRLPLVVFLQNESRVHGLRAEQRFDVQPVGTLFEKNQFLSAFHLRELVGSCVRRQIDNRLANESAALGGQQQGISQHNENHRIQELGNRFHGNIRLRFEGSMQSRMQGMRSKCSQVVLVERRAPSPVQDEQSCANVFHPP